MDHPVETNGREIICDNSLGVQSGASYLLQGFGYVFPFELQGPAWAVGSYSISQSARGTSQNIIYKTLRQIGRPALYSIPPCHVVRSLAARHIISCASIGEWKRSSSHWSKTIRENEPLASIDREKRRSDFLRLGSIGSQSCLSHSTHSVIVSLA